MVLETSESRRDKFPIPGSVSMILGLLGAAGHEAYIAGGAVRDMLLGLVPHDFDISSSCSPDVTAKVLAGAGIRYLDNASVHGTVTAILEDGNIEITTFRVDGKYSDLRRPDSVTFAGSIEEDVRRRDFTVNSLYMDKDGTVRDITGGIKDLEAGLIRTVGNPEERFGEDALRILRAMRFSSRFGFRIDDETFAAMEKCAGELKQISAERIASELTGIVCGKDAPAVIRRCWKILSVIIPEIAVCHGFDQYSKFHDRDCLEHTLDVLGGIPLEQNEGSQPSRDPVLATAALFHDLGKPECFKLDLNGTGHMKGHPEAGKRIALRVLTGLRYPQAFVREVCTLVEFHDIFTPNDKSAVHRFLCACGPELYEKLKILQKADIMAHSELGKKRLARLEYMSELADELKREGAVYQAKDLEISGNDIISLGCPEGPEVGNVLEMLFEKYLAGEIVNDRDELQKTAKDIIC
ncbi:MAG: CCA tRNA nucleotidyltransferase [Ruminococcaceae bacterium]|nr:CCA tRNA nucleotidyltransferase [Oscillospiraceae bacterium]